MDPILFWNNIALEADRVSHTAVMGEQRGPVLSARALGIVHLAMHDAYSIASGNQADLPPYLPNLPPAPVGALPAEAVAGAAYTALVRLYPSQRAFFDLVLGLGGQAPTPSQEFGATVARALLADRQNDPGADATGYLPPVERGRHQPDPFNPDQGFYAPFYGARSKGFAIGKRHELHSPPQPGEDEYVASLRQVRAKGILPELTGALPANLQNRERSVDQTLIGIFWAYDGAVGLGTPARFYNQIVRIVAQAQGNDVKTNARLFALVNAALADAGILAWDQKYIHNFWRPVVGIREHDISLGPATEPRHDISDDSDTQWLPLGAPATNRPGGRDFTPPFPAYPSGHATFGAAALQMTRLFYGHGELGKRDHLFDGLSVVSEELNGISRDSRGAVRPRHLRSFPGGLWQMIEENARSRVYLGVHWLFDAFLEDNGKPVLELDKDPVGGVPLGLKIACDIFGGARNQGLKKSPVGPR